MPGTGFTRYAFGAFGPIGTALAQLALLLLLVQRLDLRSFGGLALLLAFSQLGLRLWQALVCLPLFQSANGPPPGEPLPARAEASHAAPADRSGGPDRGQDRRQRREDLRLGLASANLVAALGAGAVLGGLALVAGINREAAALIAGYGLVTFLRAFAQADALAHRDEPRVVASDLAYVTTMLALVAFIQASGVGSLAAAFSALLLASTVALIPLGRRYGLAPLLAFRPARARTGLARLALTPRGLLAEALADETRSRSYLYLVALIAGPAPLAALAAPALLVRPVDISSAALSQAARPLFALEQAGGPALPPEPPTPALRLSMIAAWIVTAAGVLLLIFEAPRLVFPPAYELADLRVACLLWILIAAARALWAPDHLLAQLGGQGRGLLRAGQLSAIVTVLAIVSLVLAAGPLGALVGLLVGEVLYGLLLARLIRCRGPLGPTRHAAPASLSPRTRPGG